MNGTTTAFTSKTILSGMLVIVSSIIGLFGFHMGSADQANLIQELAQIGAAIGGIGAIYGRIVATKVIGTTPTPPVTAADIAAAVAQSVGPAVAAAIAAQKSA